MSPLKVLAFTFALLTSVSALAGDAPSCSDAIDTPSLFTQKSSLMGIHLEVDHNTDAIKSRFDRRFVGETRRLLNLLSNTLFDGVSEKLTDEKGELFLAEDLPNGNTIEFVYAGDKRTGDPIFRLQEIFIVKPNGEKLTIDEDPIDDGGNGLLRSSHILSVNKRVKGIEIKALSSTSEEVFKKNPQVLKFMEDKAEEENGDVIGLLTEASPLLSETDRAKVRALQENSVTVKVPATISGPVLKELVSWGKRLEYIERSELQNAILKKRLPLLRLTSHAREAAEDMVDGVIRKETMKWVYAVALVATLQQAPNAVSNAYHAWEDSKKGVVEASVLAESSVTVEGAMALKTILKSAGANPSELQPVLVSLGKRTEVGIADDRVSELAKLQSQVKKMAAAEKHFDGKAKYYISDGDFQFLRMDKFPLSGETTVSADPNEPIAMISHFEKSGIIVVHAFTTDPNEIVPATASMVIRKKDFPELYKKINAKLK